MYRRIEADPAANKEFTTPSDATNHAVRGAASANYVGSNAGLFGTLPDSTNCFASAGA